MNKKIKRLLFCLMCSMVFYLCFSTGILAADMYTEGNFGYLLEGDSITITEYFGSESEVTVPSVIAGYPVSKIADGAFEETTILTLTLPDTIMTIEKDAIATNIYVQYLNKAEYTDDDEMSEDDEAGNAKEETISKDDIQDSSDKLEETETDLESLVSEQGIPTEKGNIISVDEEKHLISIAPDKKTTILDKSKEYRLETGEDGSVIIKDNQNREVTVDKDGEIKVSVQDSKRPRMTATSIISCMLVIAGIFVLMCGCLRKKQFSDSKHKL